MSLQTIDIASALAILNESYDERTQQVNHCGIRFIDRNGLQHEYLEVRKNVKVEKRKSRKPVTRGRAEINLKRNGIIMLFPNDSDHPITPKVCMIYGFRKPNSKNWLNVFH